MLRKDSKDKLNIHIQLHLKIKFFCISLNRSPKKLRGFSFYCSRQFGPAVLNQSWICG